MLFNFQLVALDKVSSWDAPDKDWLSWFGLTDGYYWLDVGDTQLLRFSAPIMRHWYDEEPEDDSLEYYVNYYVVRLWEDLLDLLPAALEPVPAPLAQSLADPQSRATWTARIGELWHILDDVDEETFDKHVVLAEWWQQRRLSTSYLKNSPDTNIWSDGAQVFIDWDTSDCESDGIPVWEATVGRFALPVADFIDEVRDFDARLMAAMAARIESIREYWPRSGPRLSLKGMEAQQADRATWLQTALDKARTRPPTDWDRVLELITWVDYQLYP